MELSTWHKIIDFDNVNRELFYRKYPIKIVTGNAMFLFLNGMILSWIGYRNNIVIFIF